MTPAALAPRHATDGWTILAPVRPMLPWMRGERIRTIRLEEIGELASLLHAEARTNPDVLQSSGIVEESEQQRADEGAIPFLVPAKSCYYAIAIALVFYLQHHAFVGFVGS